MVRRLVILVSGVAAAWLSTCGGIAIIDGDAASGGKGSGSSSGPTTTTVGPSPGSMSTVVTTGPNPECELACSQIYDCGLQQDPLEPMGTPFCPGFSGTPRDRDTFVGDCTMGVLGIGSCAQIVSQVQANDCLTVITNYTSQSAEFVFDCNNGPG